MAVVPKGYKAGRLDDLVKFRVDPEMKARIQAVCDETGQKLSAAARFLVLEGLKAHEAERKKKK